MKALDRTFVIISEGKLTRTLNAGWYNLPINILLPYMFYMFFALPSVADP